MAFTTKDSASKSIDTKKKDQTPQEEIKQLKETLKTANEANIKLSEDFSKLESKKQKAEEYIQKLTDDLRERKSLLEAMQKELKDVGGPKTDTPGPEEDAPKGPAGSVDSICINCKEKFSGKAQLIKDKESPHYLSVKCPRCSKPQNAEAAVARYNE